MPPLKGFRIPLALIATQERDVRGHVVAGEDLQRSAADTVCLLQAFRVWDSGLGCRASRLFKASGLILNPTPLTPKPPRP